MKYTQKFTGLAKVYDKFRPTYGSWVIDQLEPVNVVDVGAGTGILTKDLLELTPYRVFAVEPNADMRAELKENLKDYANSTRLYVINACAESMPIEDGTIDIVIAAMSFHWFDVEKFRLECKRILKPGGMLYLVYNSRAENNPMAQDMIALFKRTCPDYSGFSGGLTYALEKASDVFSDYSVSKIERPYTFDREAWLGRNFSSSYAPKEGDSNYEEFVNGLLKIFDNYSVDGVVTLQNDLVVIKGRVK